MKLATAILLLLFFFNTNAQKVFDFSSSCQQAYTEVMQLQIGKGFRYIEESKQANPQNLIPVYIESYIDFFTLFLNEDPQEYAQKKELFDERIGLIQTGNKNSPWFLYTQSVIYLQKAAVAIKFGETWTAGWAFRKSFLLIKENKKKFPNFLPNQLIYGALEAAVGTIPKNYKWLASLLGLRGSVKDGMLQVKTFAFSNNAWAQLMRTEGAFIYGYLNFYLENQKSETVQFLRSGRFDLVNNHLLAYMAANLGKNDKQTEFAKSIILNRSKASGYLETPVWHLELGYDLLNHLQLNDAVREFNLFLQQFKGKFYVKDTYRRLSWCYFLMGNMPAAENARKQIMSKGSTMADADKEAQKEAQTKKWPNALLLKARLLDDGGYRTEALQLLRNTHVNNYTDITDQLEFTYRMGRIYDGLDDNAKAIEFYRKAYQLGKDRTEYYAARAALQAGMIYERTGNKNEAVAYYNLCLNLGEHDYKSSLDQRAKSGIARCTGQ
ncbi:tetratricopeptide repeat protein [Hydrotalea sp.]|uniref:tetratricopeptide repeat protein n=1 Tax=Hydrotalea sp. TaxID=2881279 RepID=UPI00259116CD|nr:tetratricopeptide repeat protein [Hydrotalea sp.]